MLSRLALMVVVVCSVVLLGFPGGPTEASASVILQAPLGVETLQAGSEYPIRWTTAGDSGGQVFLHYTADAGATWTYVALLAHAPGEQEHMWTVPYELTDEVQVRVTWLVTPFVSHTSTSGTFTIVRLYRPTNLVATAVGSSMIRLNWNDNTNWETGYEVWRRHEEGEWTHVTTVGANVTEYYDGGLDQGTEYRYTVRAVNDVGKSEFAPFRTVTTWDIPAAPSQLSAVAISATEVRLQWNDESDNATAFDIGRRSNGVWNQISIIGADVTEYIDSDLLPNTSYEYRVAALNDYGPSEWSNVAGVTTLVPEEPEPEPEPEPTVEIRLYIDHPTYYVNDVSKTMDTTPIIRHGRTLLPVRYVAENIGATVSWDPVDRKAMVVRGTTVVELWLDQSQARVNGVMVSIDPVNPDVVPISIPPGRTMLPIRFVAEALDCAVVWEAAVQQVTVIYPQP